MLVQLIGLWLCKVMNDFLSEKFKKKKKLHLVQFREQNLLLQSNMFQNNENLNKLMCIVIFFLALICLKLIEY